MATSLTTRSAGPGHRIDDHQPRADGPLAGIGVTVAVEPGQVIVVESDPIEHYYRILSGTVRLYNSIADGRRQVIDFLSAGDVFGLTGLEVHACSVEAITPVTIVRYARSSLDAAMVERPQMACTLFELACAELRRAQRQLLLLGRKTADERIASFLLRLVEGDDAAPVIYLPMSRQDIGDHLGLTIETVSRILSRFRKRGLISPVGRQRIRLDGLAALHAMADGDEPRVAARPALAGWPGHQMVH